MDFLIQAIDLKFDFVPFCERKFHLVKKCDNECLSIVSCVRCLLTSVYTNIAVLGASVCRQFYIIKLIYLR